MNSAQTYWPVKIKGDVTVCVQPTIQQMSSYILLEQEDWFEDEMDFVRTYITPDMNAFDMGANHGVYALSMAKKLTTGHVWAFEPTVAPGSMLAKSIELNGFSEKLTWVHAGLSDHAHDAEMSTSVNSELNSLYGITGLKEKIHLVALDEFLKAQKINVPISFVKMDVEGEEIKVLKGGQRFFTQQSPLIMFELKHGNVVNHGLIEAIQALNYKIYRLLPDMNILVEYEASFQDGYLLNLFACKKDRAEILEKRGLLARATEMKKLGSLPETQLDWESRLNHLPFGKACSATWQSHLNECPKPYLNALSACLLAYDTSLTAAHRVRLLDTASQLVANIIKNSQAVHPSVSLLKLHLLHLCGYRANAVNFAQTLIDSFTNFATKSFWPFVPPCQLFFNRVPKQPINAWLVTCLREFIEYRRAFSTYYISNPINNLMVLHGNPDVGNAVEFRLLLCAKRSGITIDISESHPLLSPEASPNSVIWKEVLSGSATKITEIEMSKPLLTTDTPGSV
jgi:FkbM family methyltransferase